MATHADTPPIDVIFLDYPAPTSTKWEPAVLARSVWPGLPRHQRRVSRHRRACARLARAHRRYVGVECYDMTQRDARIPTSLHDADRLRFRRSCERRLIRTRDSLLNRRGYALHQ